MEDNMRFGHLMESVLFITECEGKLFDSVIKLDFQQAVAVREDAEDSEKSSKINDLKSKFTAENIKNKFNEIVEKAKAAIAKAFETVVNKILGFIKADSAIVKRYKEAIAKADLSKFPGIKNFSLPLELPDFNKICGDVAKDKIAEGGIISVEEAESYINDFLYTEDLWKPNSVDQMNKTLEGLGQSSKILKELRNASKYFMGVPFGKLINVFSKKDDKLTAEEMDTFTANCKAISKIANIYLNGCIEIFKRCRKAVLAVGAYAIKGLSKKQQKAADAAAANTSSEDDDEWYVEESVEAFIYMIGEASDFAVNEAFAY